MIADLTKKIKTVILVCKEVNYMEVKSYKKLKNNLYEITLDNGEKHKLYDDVILRYELLIDKELKKKKLEEILSENALLDAYYRALKYINTKLRTELEIRKYLFRYEFSNDQIDYAISRLKADGYINESLYVQAFINDSITLSLNGPKKIKDTLNKLGLNETLIDSYLSKIPSDTWLPRIKKIVEKKAKINKSGERVFKNKVYSDLVALGYYSYDIKSFLDSFTLDTGDIFKREADKMYNKLSSKYSGVELELRFKQKMFAKGFDSDDISNYLNQ